jgi:hypothetical protein
MTTYVSNDSVLYLDEITRLCTSKTNSWKSLFIMIPLRLGLHSLNEVYIPSLKALYQFPQCLGIAGGKPRAAMYFVAIQGTYYNYLLTPKDTSFFYLDPHVVQPAVNMTELPFSSEVRTICCKLIIVLSLRNTSQDAHQCCRSFLSNWVLLQRQKRF